ncbi:MAG: lysophospholipase [Gallionellales bacterium RIFCSPLOWO2_02_FULL_57_47]|nr:MAG: lysophospholipase [Gallionellales bacterium RIFCSPLOWO2_02_FULL_57_47]OGT13557.1 MAG: lysophospholipase [Gallionellales bacterium RIFCSPHIGHO2_02_FULL_57_16]
MRMMWNILGVLAAAYGGLSLWLLVFQSNLVFYPEIDREVAATPALAKLQYEDIHLKTADGIDLHGWYVPAPQPRGTVLFLHGNAGNISHRLDSIEMFYRLGYSTLIFDYRGYGNSGGKPTEQGTYRDAEAAWRYLTEQRHIPECRIVLFGESMGGAVAAWMAARQNPAALVISSGFTSVPDLGQQLYPYLPVRLLARIRYDTRESLRSVTAPVLIAHSKADDIIPYEHGRALFAAANPPKQFLDLAGGHNDGFIFMRETWVKALGDFLGEHVARRQPPDCR